MKNNTTLLSKITALPISLRYLLLGGGFGLLFPFGAWIISLIEHGLPLTPSSIVIIHQESLLHWIIDTAPMVLAGFGLLIGLRQEQILELNEKRRQALVQQEQLIAQLHNQQDNQIAENERTLLYLRTAAQIAALANAETGNTSRSAGESAMQSLRAAAQLISEQLGFYHVGIFLISESGGSPGNVIQAEISSTTAAETDIQRYAVLQAASGQGTAVEGEQRMLERGHRLAVSTAASPGRGIVGYVAGFGQPKIALDVGSEAVFFDNPDLPDTRSEMALPIKIAGRTIGVLDIQSSQAGAFTEKDLTVMAIVADILASTIENARLFIQARTSLDEIRSLHQQYLERSWLDVQSSASQNTLAYTYSNAEQVESDANTPARTLQVPIKVREQIIGYLTLEAPQRESAGQSEWLPEELGLIEGVITQAALALENARLLDETRRRAARERITSNVSSKVWAFSDIDTILRTALQELGQSLGAEEGVIEVEVQE